MTFPLEPEHYFGIAEQDNDTVTSRGVWVVQIRRAIGQRSGTVFDADTDRLTRAWQEDTGLPITGQVHESDWDSMFPNVSAA